MFAYRSLLSALWGLEKDTFCVFSVVFATCQNTAEVMPRCPFLSPKTALSVALKFPQPNLMLEH